MENTYLQQVLQVLNKAEWRDFGDFVASPYFNKNEKFVRFYQFLQPFYPKFDITGSTKEQLYIHATLADKYSDAGYRNLCSDLLVLVQEFLAQESLNTGNTIKESLINRTLILRGVLDLAERNVKKAETMVAKSEFDFQEKLMSAIWINDLRVLHSIYNNRKSINASNPIMLEDNTHKFISEWALLRIFSALMNNLKATKSYNLPLDKKKYETYLNLYEALQPFEHKETKIVYLICKMNVWNDEAAYFECFEIIKSLDFTRNIKTNENLIIGLLDFVDFKMNEDEKWRKELFAVYDIKLSNRLWNEKKMLSYASLFNAVHNSLQLNNIAYAETILKKHIADVSPKIESTINNLCWAWIHFFKGDYNKAHEHLVDVETENMMVKYEMRSLQCLIYLQKKEWDLLNATLESFRQFIAYNKPHINDYVSHQFSLFCKNITLIAKLHPDYLKKDIEKIAAQLSTEKNSYMRNWMLEKINSGK